MFHVLNHHTRNCDEQMARLAAQSAAAGLAPPAAFTDRTNPGRRLPGPTPKYLGLCTNFLNILRHPCPGPWKVVVHDDINIPDGLVDRIVHVLAAAPERCVVSFYNPSNSHYVAAAMQRHRVLRSYSRWWSQCHAWRSEAAAEFVAWADEKIEPGSLGTFAEDRMAARFFTRRNVPMYAVVPGFVQHDGFDRSTFGIPATIAGRSRRSVTCNLAQDVRAVDWPAEFARPYEQPGRKWGTEPIRE